MALPAFPQEITDMEPLKNRHSWSVRSNFGQLLREKFEREGKKHSINEVAEVTGLPWRTIALWAEDNTKMYNGRVLAIFCEYLDCDISDILVLEKDDSS